MTRNTIHAVVLAAAVLILPVTAGAQQTTTAETRVSMSVPRILELGLSEQVRPLDFGLVQPGGRASVDLYDAERTGEWTMNVLTNIPDAALDLSLSLETAGGAALEQARGVYQVNGGDWVEIDPARPFRVRLGQGDHVVRVRVGGSVRAASSGGAVRIVAGGTLGSFFAAGDDE